jgi:hypothetical protein
MDGTNAAQIASEGYYPARPRGRFSVHVLLDRTRGRRGIVVGTLAIALVATMLAAGPAPAASSCTTPPETTPPEQLQSGMTGFGWTTIRGSTPTQFTVEVLGVMPDYIWLDIDAIVVRITGPGSFLDETGGVFYGMSGSPVYVGGKLIGAVSYAVSWDPTIVGLTPADAMLDMFDDGTASVSLPQRIPFDDATRRAVARSLGVSSAEIVGGLELLPPTFGASGLSQQRVADLQRMVEERGSPARVVSGGSMPANLPVDPTPFVPGEPIGSVLSWGDFTLWAAGTTAIVCGNDLVAYGHTLGLRRDINVGMTGVDVLAVGSGGGIFPGDMVPALTEPRGVFLHDGFAGQSGTVGMEIPSAPISSQMTSLDTGESRAGVTDAIYQDDWWFEYIVWGHHVLNAGVLLGSWYTPGSMDLEWTINGTRADGSPWTVENHTLIASTYDATEALWRLINTIDQLVFQSFEEIEFTSIDTTSAVTEDQLIGEITQIRTSSSIDRKLAERGTVRAKPGERVTVEVTLASPTGDGTTVVVLTVRAPRRGDQKVAIRGGRERYNVRADSFDELIEALSGGEHSSDLIVQAGGRTRVYDQDLMVQGRGSFRIEVAR